MKLSRQRLLAALALCLPAWGMGAWAQTGLSVTVNVDQPGTLFQKLHEQLDGKTDLDDELLAVAHLTLSGTLNNDDGQVLRYRLKNLITANLAGLTAESGPYIALTGYEQLTTVVLPSQLTELNYRMFADCISLTTVNIPTTVTSISSSAFKGCSSLQSITLPAALTSIGGDCFMNCTSLSSVNLPASLERIDGYAFNNTALTSVVLPATVTDVGSYSFAACQQLKSFTFCEGLTGNRDLGSCILSNCPQLTTVVLPQSLTTIPEAMLMGCTSLTSVSIPQSVTTIGTNAFRGCTAMKQFSIPSTVTSLGDGVFRATGLTSFSWPAAFDHIPAHTFDECASLQSVSLPPTLKMIGENAFSDCTAMTSFTVPESVDSIVRWAFYRCTALQNIHLPSKLRVVPDYLCSGCTALAQVDLPASVYYIGSEAFKQCPLTHIDLHDGITTISGGAFSECPLTELTLPKHVKTIGRDAFALGQYERVEVPEGCETIGETAFSAEGLKYFELPSSVTYVQSPLHGYACPDSIVFRGAMPPECGIYSQWYYTSWILKSGNMNENIYVPQSSVDIYKTAWGEDVAPHIKPLTGYDPQTLYIFNNLTLDATSGYQQQKHDMVLWRSEGDFPTAAGLTVEEGTSLQLGRYTQHIDWKVEHWWNDRRTHNIASLINHGTMQATQKEFIFWLGEEKNTAFFAPPFDVRVGDITGPYATTPILLRRWDGEARARGDFDHTWVNMQADEVLRAGQGYILYTGYAPVEQEDGGWRFDGYQIPITMRPLSGGQDYTFASTDITIPLNHYSGEFAHNKGWNLVGIPYSSYFDLRGIDYDGPVLLTYGTKWTNQMFRAMSPLDDQYVFIPLSAVFIQVPDGVDAVTFLQERRQHNSVYVPDPENTNSARALRRADQNRSRVVYNATLSRSTQEGAAEELHATRFVINPQATLRYDIGRDAPCIAGGDSVPALLYTQAGGVAYAINERPLADGAVSLGMQLLSEGDYTLSLSVKGAAGTADVWLHDLSEGTRTLLVSSTGAPVADYTFHAPAGTVADRFVITLGDAQPTAIETAEAATPMRAEGLFNLGGLRLSQPAGRGIYIENGKKIIK